VEQYFSYNIAMARPTKNSTDKKSVDLRIPVTIDQKELVVSAAKLDGLEMAAWARPILVREAQKRLKRR
jgi:hypothetical protein